jgi:hypothetical protein
MLIIVCGFVAGCTSASSPVAATTSTPRSPNSPVDRVEVFHFHGTQQCYSCRTVGDLAEQTVNDNFKIELASGQLVFAHVNYDLPENAALKTAYGVTGSSLWIGVYDADGFHKKQETSVWYLIDDPDAYSAHLSEVVTKRLTGDLS